MFKYFVMRCHCCVNELEYYHKYSCISSYIKSNICQATVIITKKCIKSATYPFIPEAGFGLIYQCILLTSFQMSKRKLFLTGGHSRQKMLNV